MDSLLDNPVDWNLHDPFDDPLDGDLYNSFGLDDTIAVFDHWLFHDLHGAGSEKGQLFQTKIRVT